MENYQINLVNNKFSCKSNETVLEGALRSGLLLDHSCLSGRCRTCKAQLISGQVEDKQSMVVSSKNSEILTCLAKPLSDIDLDLEDISGFDIEKKRIVPAKVNEIIEVSDTVVCVQVRLPPNSTFKFAEGQYVNIIKGAFKRSYSIANSYKKGENELTFYIKLYKDGQMSNYLMNEAKVNDLLRLEGPLGTFFLRNYSTRNIIFLATGTGIAPIISLINKLKAQPNTNKIYVFWGNRYSKDFFLNDTEFNHPNLKLFKVVSREQAKESGFEEGYVQNVLLKQNIDLISSTVYACGSELMISSARQLLVENNLPERNFFSDSFVISN